MEYFGNTIINLMFTLLVAGIIFRRLERVRPVNNRQIFYRKDFFTDISYALINSILAVPIALIFTWYFFLRGRSGLMLPDQIFTQIISSWPLPIQVICNLLLMDFVTYWRHRFSHKWAWQFHAVHHSAEEIDWLTRHRAHPIDALLATCAALLMSHIIGFGKAGLVISLFLYVVADYFNHANFRFGFKGWLRYVFVTPQFHRWHHATDKAAIDKNFAAMFSFYDFFFGSFYCPVGTYPARYGLAESVQKDFPTSTWLQLLYPFQRIAGFFKRV